MPGKVEHTYIHTPITDISNFQNGLNNPCCLTVAQNQNCES